MKLSLLGSATIATAAFLLLQQSPASKDSPASGGKSSTTAEAARADDGESKIFDLPLRRPGFLFLELRVCDVDVYRDFLVDVTGYRTVRDDAGFVILNTARGEILLSGPAKKPAEIKPSRKYGTGVEIGLVVADLDAAFAAAKKHEHWTIADKIARQSWGVRDFRVYSPDGHYLRITE